MNHNHIYLNQNKLSACLDTEKSSDLEGRFTQYSSRNEKTELNLI